MRRAVLDFLKQSLAMSLAGPLVGLIVLIAIQPGLLALAALTFTLPFLVLGAWAVGSVPAFLTSIVLYFARSRLDKISTVLVSAGAAAGFGATWVYWIGHGRPGYSSEFIMFVAPVSAAASLMFSVPKWDAR